MLCHSINVCCLVEQTLSPELCSAIQNVQGVHIVEREEEAQILVVSNQRLDASKLASLPNLKFIQKWGSGIDNIDKEAARKYNILISRMAGANAEAVAEHALALIFGTTKQLFLSARQRQWSQQLVTEAGVLSLRRLCLGIIGYGHIGQALFKRAQVLFAKVLVSGRTNSSFDNFFTPTPALLKQSDIVVVAASHKRGSIPIIGEPELTVMKPSATLVNVARASAVDQKASVRAVNTQKLRAFLSDVPDGEPAPDFDCFDGINTILTPHIAGRDQAAVLQMNTIAVNNIRHWLTGSWQEITGIVDL